MKDSAGSPKANSTAERFDWRYVRSIVAEHRRELLTANLVAVLATLTSVPIPLLMPLLVDEVLLHRPGVTVELLNRLAPPAWHGAVLYITAVLVLTLVLRLLALVLNVWHGRLFTRISKDVAYRIRTALIARLKVISMAEYETLGGGSLVSHLVTDLDTIDQFVGASVSKTLVAVLTIIGTAAVLLWMHWQLALFILLLNPVVIFFTQALGKRVKALKKQENAALEAFQIALTETLDAIHQIRASNREHHYLNVLIGKAGAVREHSAAFAWRSDAANRQSFLVFLFGFDVFRALAMFMVFYSNLSVGEMLAVFGYLWFMMAPVQEVLSIQYALFGANAALARINRLMELREEPHYPHIVNPFEGRRTVGVYVKDLTFGYNGAQPVLNGVTLDIRAGEKVALVGASGGGKSTLVQVLIGLYAPNAGTVFYDGIPVTDIGLDVVREHVATVLQNPVLFNDTVRANLTLGRNYPDAVLWQALEVAQLLETVLSSDRGLDTLVGRSGMRLSGGQRQRLAIARMVLADPKVVILDEATSALDADTEYRLHAALSEFLSGRTTLIVAHRLSAVRQADRVYVFEDGRICEQGDHDMLMARNGLYAKLYGERQRSTA